jgi:hypothetical protein
MPRPARNHPGTEFDSRGRLARENQGGESIESTGWMLCEPVTGESVLSRFLDMFDDKLEVAGPDQSVPVDPYPHTLTPL